MEVCRHVKMWIDAWSSVPICHGVSFSSGRLPLLGSFPALARRISISYLRSFCFTNLAMIEEKWRTD